ncbi:MAG: AAA family ATPase, partial [Candidatus Omnitrophica bacterium]|nr:AAA family ATPase [Candidatus Omnitrophota bacterium]
VEGAGGVLVPINKKTFLIDIVKRLKLGVVVVVGNKLGAINHTFLTIEALNLRKIKILGIVFNNFLQGENENILKDNAKIVKELSKENILGVLSFAKDVETLYNKFKLIGKNILKLY